MDYAKIIWSETFKGCQEQLDEWLDSNADDIEVVSMHYQVGEYVSVLIHYRSQTEAT